MTKNTYNQEQMLILEILKLALIVYDVFDLTKRRELPLYDFNEIKVDQTPASFCAIKGCMKQKKEDILIDTSKQRVVTIRPKYYNGGSGSVCAPACLRFCHEQEQPQLFQKSGLRLRNFCLYT